MTVLAPEQKIQQLPLELEGLTPETDQIDQLQLDVGAIALVGTRLIKYDKGELFKPEGTKVFYLEDSGSWSNAAKKRLTKNGIAIAPVKTQSIPEKEEILSISTYPNKIAYHGLVANVASKIAWRAGELADSFGHEPNPDAKLEAKIQKQHARQTKWQQAAQNHRLAQSKLRQHQTPVKQNQIF